jgi:hypothetical protein
LIRRSGAAIVTARAASAYEPDTMPRMRSIVWMPLIGLAACAASQPEPHYPSTSLGSGYAFSGTVPTAREVTGVGMSHELVEAGLVVRPDEMIVDVRITKEAPSAAQALALAQAAATDLVARLQQAAPGATFTPCGTRVTPMGGYSKTTASTESFDVTLEGRVEVAFAPELDYWRRSGLVVALGELAGRYEAARAAKTADMGVFLHSTRVAVKNAEGYRGKLTEIWVQRARAFATAAQAHEAPLYLLDCAPPGEITQTQKSLEEVALSLAVSCRLGSPKGASAAAR